MLGSPKPKATLAHRGMSGCPVVLATRQPSTNQEGCDPVDTLPRAVDPNHTLIGAGPLSVWRSVFSWTNITRWARDQCARWTVRVSPSAACTSLY